MKITKKIAAATLVPAAAAGIAVSGLAIASADQPGGHQKADGLQASQRHAAGSAARHRAKATARPGAEAFCAPQDGQAGRHQRRHEPCPQARGWQGEPQGTPKAHHKAAAKPAPVAAAPSPTSMFTGMSAFERCVAWRESGDNPTASSAGMFGILPSTWASLGYPGTAGTSSVALQKEAFNRLYAMDGTSPWAPYDGC